MKWRALAMTDNFKLQLFMTRLILVATLKHIGRQRV